jgi:hypothetical protein
MNDARTRLVVLAVLATLGVSLAGAGVALGIGDAIASGDRMGEVTVAGSNVTVASSDGEVVLTETVPETSDIEISEDAGGITVAERAGNDDPFTQRERERAVEIARNNDIVSSYLETVADPTVTVHPVEKLNATEMQTETVAFNVSERDDIDVSGEDTQVLKVTNVTIEESGDSVTIDREPSYVEDLAVVHVNHPDRTDARYWVRVDLANETVVDITDWKDM